MPSAPACPWPRRSGARIASTTATPAMPATSGWASRPAWRAMCGRPTCCWSSARAWPTPPRTATRSSRRSIPARP
ncbi:Uncharacterised protein [Bordetella pertussis]|nr:Uncharacterised protein [Bordetella pertussis]